MSLDAVFVHDGAAYTPTELALGPWYADALHGGAPAALLVHELTAFAARSAPELRLARVTLELVRPVPRAPLRVEVTPLRPGRRVTLLEAVIRDAGGVEVTRARALFVLPSELGPTPTEPPPFAGPEAGRPNDFGSEHRPMFANQGMEIRFIEGRFREPGSATAWFRLRYPLIRGREIGPLERVTAAGDFGNGIASVLSWDEHTFINPDLTLMLERDPVDEWVALDAEMRVLPGSVAVAESVLYDRAGRIGRAIQTLLVGRRPPT
jgi:acyl-coenzyme A thioesterase PaaI-like protein